MHGKGEFQTGNKIKYGVWDQGKLVTLVTGDIN